MQWRYIDDFLVPLVSLNRCFLRTTPRRSTSCTLHCGYTTICFSSYDERGSQTNTASAYDASEPHISNSYLKSQGELSICKYTPMNCSTIHRPQRIWSTYWPPPRTLGGSSSLLCFRLCTGRCYCWCGAGYSCLAVQGNCWDWMPCFCWQHRMKPSFRPLEDQSEGLNRLESQQQPYLI
jgi:hypothetical protein